jgi:hypothetical protein
LYSAVTSIKRSNRSFAKGGVSNEVRRRILNYESRKTEMETRTEKYRYTSRCGAFQDETGIYAESHGQLLLAQLIRLSIAVPPAAILLSS